VSYDFIKSPGNADLHGGSGNDTLVVDLAGKVDFAAMFSGGEMKVHNSVITGFERVICFAWGGTDAPAR
jgi:hypothetical protein